MAWSPLPTHRDLIAVGLSTGRTMVLSLSPQTLAVPLASKSGPDAAHSTTVATLALKNPRSSTCVAFSSLDPNYFATGYDRHRSDYSLLIWDLSSSISSLPADGDTSWQRPPDRLDIINPRAAQDPGKGEPRHIQHYGASEQVNDVAFLPGTYSILASTNNKAVRMFDLRSPSPGHTPDPSNSISMQWTTRAVSSLSPDPFSPHRFASYESSSSGSTVRLWDTRKAGSDILSLDIGGAILGIGWAPGGSGVSRLSVGTRDGINVWDVISGRTVGEEDGREWTSLGEMKQGEWPEHGDAQVTDLRSVIRPKQHLQSYTLSNSIHSFRSDVFFVLKDGSLNVGSLVNAPKIASGARGDVTIVSTAMTAIDSRRAGDVSPLTESTESDDEHGTITRANPFQLQPARVSTILAEAQNSRSASPAPSSLLKGVRRDATPGHEDEPRATGVPSGHLDWISWQRVLGAEISLTMQRRAAEGYGVANVSLPADLSSSSSCNSTLLSPQNTLATTVSPGSGSLSIVSAQTVVFPFAEHHRPDQGHVPEDLLRSLGQSRSRRCIRNMDRPGSQRTIRRLSVILHPLAVYTAIRYRRHAHRLPLLYTSRARQAKLGGMGISPSYPTPNARAVHPKPSTCSTDPFAIRCSARSRVFPGCRRAQ